MDDKNLDKVAKKSGTNKNIGVGCTVVGFIFVVVLILVNLSMCDDKKDKNKVTATEQTSGDAGDEKSSLPPRPKINEEENTGEFVFKVTKTVYKKYKGHLVLVVGLVYKNVSDAQITLSYDNFKLTDEFGTTYSASSDLNLNESVTGGGIYYEECNPNIDKKGYVVFEVPKEDHYFLFISNELQEVTGIIDLVEK